MRCRCDLCGTGTQFGVTMVIGLQRFDGHEKCMEQLKKILEEPKESDRIEQK